jgi:hypothetical protein
MRTRLNVTCVRTLPVLLVLYAPEVDYRISTSGSFNVSCAEASCFAGLRTRHTAAKNGGPAHRPCHIPTARTHLVRLSPAEEKEFALFLSCHVS